MTDTQKKHIDTLRASLKKYKEENAEAEFVTLTTLKKFSGLGKGRIRNTLKLAKMPVEVAMVPNFDKEGREAGEVKQFQISL